MAASETTSDGHASVITAILAVIAAAALMTIVRRRHMRALSEWALPLIGQTPEFIRDSLAFVCRMHRAHGEGFTTSILLNRMSVFSSETAHRALLKHDNKSLCVDWPPVWQRLLGRRSLTVVSPDENQRQRKAIASAFGPRVLADSLPALLAITEETLDTWATRHAAPFELLPAAKRWAFDVATTFLFGTRYASADAARVMGLFHTWLDAFGALLPLDLPFTAVGRGMRARAALIEHFGARLDAARRAPASLPASCALAKLLAARDEGGAPLDDETLKDAMLALLFAGHDTTSHVICTLVHTLALAPAGPPTLERLRAELDAAWDGSAPSLSPELLARLPVLDATISETLRLEPPVTHAFRLVTADVDIGGARLVAGERVAFSLIGKQRGGAGIGSEALDEPESWRIDRFLGDEPLDKAHPLAVTPFGIGPRMCLGYQLARLELRVLLALLARGYEWEVRSSTRLTFPFWGHSPLVCLRRRQPAALATT